jgi:glutamate dehydrogenase (NADP+)
VKNGCYLRGRGRQHALHPRSRGIFQEHKILYGPGKAANAGGVATSGLEMSQNSLKLSWTREEVDHRLLMIMKSIHASCLNAAEAYGRKGDYVAGANIAGFLKVAKPCMAYGVV